MNSDPLLDRIVEAVLYEGYLLYPYRASAKKNQERFTFGRVYPEAYHDSQKGAEPCAMRTECLLRPEPDEDTRLRIAVRFLQPTRREVGVLSSPTTELPSSGEPTFELVPEYVVDGERYQTWHEATERTVSVNPEPGKQRTTSVPASFPASRELEPIRDGEGQIVAVLVRTREALDGRIDVACRPVDENVVRVAVELVNMTPMTGVDASDRDGLLMRTFASAHAVLQVEGGEFLSQTDPPADYQEAAAACRNEGAWPVLVGDESKGERHTLLASPIILQDYPQIAPESAGDYYDGTEIDEMLALRILTMTEEEKGEMRGIDEHARSLLERTESLGSDHLASLHGTLRGVDPGPAEAADPFDQYIFGRDSKKIETVTVDGVSLKPGDAVVVRPKSRADAFDMMLTGKRALIEALEEDAEGNVHLAVLIDDDPGKDLGALRQPGHRFFYRSDEVEPAPDGKGAAAS